MIKYIRITSAAALLAGVAGAAVILEENFEGAKFPPAGWEKVEVRGAWTRENVGAPYDWCAYFHSFAYVGGEGTLRTKGQELNAVEHAVSFAYRYRAEPAGGTASAQARVERLDGEVWQVVSSWPLPKISAFQLFEFKHAAAAPAGTYRLLFYADAAEEAIVFFRIDNVTWESGPFTAVAPASLGRVKALYY